MYADAEAQPAGDRDVDAAREVVRGDARARVWTAAPASTIRSVTCRPCSGSSTIRSCSTTSLMPALRTSTSGAAASTETVSSRFPTPSAALITGRGADLQHDAGLHVGAESLQRHFQPVRTGRQVRHHVGAGVVGDDGSGESGVGLRRGHGDAGQHRAAFIGHAAVQLRRRLRPGGGGGQNQSERTHTTCDATHEDLLEAETEPDRVYRARVWCCQSKWPRLRTRNTMRDRFNHDGNRRTDDN